MSWVVSLLPAAAGAIFGTMRMKAAAKTSPYNQELVGQFAVLAAIPQTLVVYTLVMYILAWLENSMSELGIPLLIMGLTSLIAGVGMGETGRRSILKIRKIQDFGPALVKVVLWLIPAIFAMMYFILEWLP